MKIITRDKIIKSCSHDREHSLSIGHKELETPIKKPQLHKKMSLVQIYDFIVVKQVKIKIRTKSNRLNLKQKCELVIY